MKAKVIAVTDETPLVRTIKLKLSEKIIYKPGQFISLIFTEGEGVEKRVARRAYSISHWVKQPTDEVPITLNVSPDGKYSKIIYNAKLGATFECDGPHGIFVPKESKNPMLFIAAGTGITPLMTMMEALKDSGREMCCLYSVKKPENIIFRKELAYLKENHKLHCCFTLTQEVPKDWDGQKGRVTKEMIQKVYKKNAEIYICGMPEFVKIVQIHLAELNISKELIHIERW